jgi:hypothetical protein
MFSKKQPAMPVHPKPLSRPHGPRKEGFQKILLLVLLPVVVAGILVATYGDLSASFGFILLLLVIGGSLYRIEWGFYVFIGAVLALDQFPIPGIETITSKIPYFQNLKEISGLQTVSFAVVSPLELHFFFIFLLWIVLLAVKKDIVVNHVPVWWSALLFFCAIMIPLIYGMWVGGDFLVALWEIRALIYFLVLYFFVPQIIQTRRQVEILMWVVIAAISFKALQGCQRFIEFGFSFAGLPTLTNHEDPVFIGTLFIFLFGLSLFGVLTKQRRILKWLVLPLILGFVVGQRRAAYGAFIASTIAFLVLVPKKKLLKYVKFIVPAVFVFLIYLAVFWNSEGRLGSPIKLLKTSLASEQEEAADRYYSNLYREYERYDLARTVQRSPLKGIGFGNMYDQPIWLESMPMFFTLRDYIPHNEFLWLLVKMGTLGFFTFCLFFTSYVFYGSSLFATLQDPYLKAVCGVALTVGISQIFVSYFDLQLTYYRNMIYFGTMMGLLPTLQSIDRISIQKTTPGISQ